MRSRKVATLPDLSSRFRDLARLSAHWMWETDAAGRLVWQEGHSPRVEAVDLADYLLGATLGEILQAIAAEPLQELTIDVALQRRAPFSDIIYRYMDALDGETWICLSGLPLCDDHGRPGGYRGIASDVSALARSEIELRHTNRHLTHSAELAGLGYWVWDLQRDCFLECSETLARICGVTLDEFMESNRSGKAFIHPDDLAEYTRIEQAFNDGGERYEVVYRVLARDGIVRICREIGERVAGRGGRPDVAIGTVQDITEDYRLQAELSAAKEQLEKQIVAERVLFAELRQKEERLRTAQKLEAVSRLASGIAHDLNNILLPVIVLAERLAETLPPGADRKDAQTILEGAERGAALLRDLLDFTREKAGSRECCDPAQVIASTLPMIRAVLPPGIDLRTRIKRDLGLVDMSGALLSRVLLNLASNAADAMAGTGRLFIGLDEVGGDGGDKLRLRVRDTGCGIGPEEMGRIFDPFFTTKPIGKGTGLGLSVVHGIVTAHEGSIAVTSQPGQGTTFEVILPRNGVAVAGQLEDVLP
ncbi:PAS domain-containing sensor histidine kinase [Rhodoligotrophos defluvii]|uniref:PAS domain-containing sensor histidine kinase n=1 Tax=Rhodoligotrophos defluvii TaxID=2561934 RepID=UPI001484CCA6|nr:ATP-binding protein [Rhodoligotrophos defluvii]